MGYQKENYYTRQIVRYYSLGFNATWIAEQLGLAKMTVEERIRSEGVWKKRKGEDPVKVKQQHRHSVTFWIKKYGLPANSCWKACKDYDAGHIEKDGLGKTRLITEREFLSAVLHTRSGRKLIGQMLEKGLILTRESIRNILIE